MIVHQNDNKQGSNGDGPVTVIMTGKARKGKIRDLRNGKGDIIY